MKAVSENRHNAIGQASKKRKAMYDLPTKEEQMHLRETEDLMRTNLMKLQVEELLGEVSIDGPNKLTRLYDEWLLQFNESLRAIKFNKKVVLDAKWLSDNHIPLMLESYEKKPIQLVFQPPVETNITGSYVQNTITKPFLNIDILVAMPDQCFDSK